MAERDHVEDLRNLVATQLPDYRVDAVVVLGEGLDNKTYEVNGQLLVRISKEPDPAHRAARVRQEARLLAAVTSISPLPVPEPIFALAEQGCIAYRKLPGVPLLDVPQQQRAAHARSIAATLGELLTGLHAVPVDRMAALVFTDDQPLAQWRQEAAETFAAVAGKVPAARRRAVETFLAVPPPTAEYAPVFSHNEDEAMPLWSCVTPCIGPSRVLNLSRAALWSRFSRRAGPRQAGSPRCGRRRGSCRRC